MTHNKFQFYSVHMHAMSKLYINHQYNNVEKKRECSKLRRSQPMSSHSLEN